VVSEAEHDHTHGEYGGEDGPPGCVGQGPNPGGQDRDGGRTDQVGAEDGGAVEQEPAAGGQAGQQQSGSGVR
jgi:hypothetical protein